ncbi:MAG TPA: aminomethyl-transferring glycine dehydrogenase [Polyangiaceae bacterium]|nr:aminomethyl-transferring glycine dehydrogenase [Polyangiaceae bacterium]
MSVSLEHADRFVTRHVGPAPKDIEKMLGVCGAPSLDALISETVPESIRLGRALKLPRAKSEHELLELARMLGGKNRINRSLIGLGYSDCVTPPVILRNVLQNPGWYTQYTPYQAEIAQGRLEALLVFQTMVEDLTGFEVANASLLDEGTAAAEAMHLCYEFKGGEGANVFFVSDACLPQTIEVVRTRGAAIGIDVVVGDAEKADLDAQKSKIFGMLLQYPASDGALADPRKLTERVHAHGGLVVMAADILSLAVVTPPGELGADVAVGSTQRFGVPLGYGGPHAAYFATKNEFVRKLPGRIIGVSEDASGKPALRMALQTREQHIRREKATSNICTAQALLAVMAGLYAAYHGPEGLRRIATRVHGLTATLAHGLRKLGFTVAHGAFFDTLRVSASVDDCDRHVEVAHGRGINLRRIDETSIGISLDEVSDEAEVSLLLDVFGGDKGRAMDVVALAKEASSGIPESLRRTSSYLSHEVFHAHRSETEMLRYIRMLQERDLSLVHSMIPLGSCTMKLNAAAEMLPITDPSWNRIHPFAPRDQAEGYSEVFRELEGMLSEITGFPGVSLQPNAGAQGEYTGLLVIRRYLESKGEGHRNVCLIPQSAHGTNPASAVMAGMKVVVTKTDAGGNVDLADLEAQAKAHSKDLAALMLTYPSTHGVFEQDVKKICEIIHANGGQVYMDGANMNAQVGLCRPADIGADVCHINLHKTFCIPHGGGGPGMGPIGVAKHLVELLPDHPVTSPHENGKKGKSPITVSAAPWGSASILLISWAYIHMMGAEGLTQATKVAILSANYVAKKLEKDYPVVYKGSRGRVAHECIFDVRPLKKTAHIEVDDVAKRLMDYGFHSPTMSFPIPGTLMVEPTESEPLAELDRFCTAMTKIREEIRAIEEGKLPQDDNPLKNAPHTQDALVAAEWTHPYSREVAAFPAPWLHARKFWPAVARINNAFGDRHLVCSCPPIEAYGV